MDSRRIVHNSANVTESSAQRASRAPRKKQWAPKVATGCLTCRARRIKCDEFRPACRRCTSTGRYCRGYTAGAVESTPPHLNHQPEYSQAPVGIHPSTRERQMFHLLRTHTVTEIAGGYDPLFWTHDVLQAAQAHPAIWHAGLAFSAFHQRMKIAAGRESHRHLADDYFTFGITQYNVSIGYLIKLTKKTNLDYVDKQAIILASTIHYGLCCVQKQIKQAMIHVQSALNLFQQWALWEQIEPYSVTQSKGILDSESLIRHVAHCYEDIQSIDSDRVPEGLAACFYMPVLSTRRPFATLTEAMFAYVPVRHNHFGECDSSGPEGKTVQRPTQNEIAARQHALNIWKDRFRDIEQAPYHQAADRDCIAYMKLQVTWDELFHHAVMDSRPESRAKLPTKWLQILDAADEQLSKRCTNSDRQSSPLPVYSFCPTPMDIVHMTGIVCRHRTVRRRAIEVLNKWPQSQGIWSSYISRLIVQAKMDYESRGMDSDECPCVPDGFVCEEHRGVSFNVAFQEEGLVSITIKNMTDLRDDLPGRVYTHELREDS